MSTGCASDIIAAVARKGELCPRSRPHPGRSREGRTSSWKSSASVPGWPARWRLAGLEQVTIGRGTRRSTRPVTSQVLAVEIPDGWMSSEQVVLRRSEGRGGTSATWARRTERSSMAGGWSRPSSTTVRSSSWATHSALPRGRSERRSGGPRLRRRRGVHRATDDVLGRFQHGSGARHQGRDRPSAGAISCGGERNWQGGARPRHPRALRPPRPAGGSQLRRDSSDPGGGPALRAQEGRLLRRGPGPFGLVRAADGGTLFLDEIGDLPAAAGLRPSPFGAPGIGGAADSRRSPPGARPPRPGRHPSRFRPAARVREDVQPGLAFVLLTATTLLLTFLLYAAFVRYTAIGRALNGPRTRGPGMQIPDPTPIFSATR